MSNPKKPALGRGLSALLQNSETDITSKSPEEKAAILGSVAEIPIDQIEVNPFQPRTNFDKEALAELALSIKELGVVQPITVRKLGYGKYQLISGERRFRASKMAELETIPAFIRVANDQEMLEMALVENIQRENLDAIEVALSYQRLVDECNLTQEELSKRVGKKRSTVANYLRLLKLPPEIQASLRDGKLTMGHARAIISVSEPKKQLQYYRLILAKGLSVRQTEELVKGGAEQKTKKKQATPLSFTQQKIKDDLTQLLQAPVKIQKSSTGKGKIVIEYMSDEQLERIAEILGL
jgi:ParB family chromosome partitioning protein